MLVGVHSTWRDLKTRSGLPPGTLADSCRRHKQALRRMQEELHDNLQVPGSNPRSRFGAVAQRIEQQKTFSKLLSPQSSH